MSLIGKDGQKLICRPYQAELEEIAIKKNTIIHLPTGSGKTFIAVRLIQRFRHEVMKPWNEGGKRSFFLVNTVPLVIQQKKVIDSFVQVSVGAYSSEDRVDYWNKAKWNEELSQHQVFVMTCQILADMLTHAYIKIEQINLLIFDECHHAVDDHPMHHVMRNFEGCPPDKQPRILGLSATLLNANVTVSQIENRLRTLESTFQATIATVNELGEVLSFSTNPFELLQEYRVTPTPNIGKNVINKLNLLQEVISHIKIPKTIGNHSIALKPGQRDISTDPNKILKEVKNMIVSMITFINELGIYGGAIAILAYTILLEMLKRKAITKEEEMLYKITISKCIETRMMLLQAMESDTGYKKIEKHSSEKVLQLLNILKEYNPSVVNTPGKLLKVNRYRNSLSAIIFARQRFMAKILYNLLKDVRECNPEFEFLKHDFVVGFNINPFKNTREQYLAKKYSQQALLKFKNQDLNCLISTSVIEEGVDIPQCSLVVQYDTPAEYRSYIQSKGRARSAESSFVILISNDEKGKFISKFCEYQRIEKKIQSMLVGSTSDRAAPTLEEIQEELEKDDIPAFVTPSGCRLTSLSAVRLLFRYCNNLSQDSFSTINPIWIQEKVTMKPSSEEYNIITVVMPLDCPVKEEVKGVPFKDLKTAKRSAALNVCKRLYEEGELDPITLLPNKFGHVDYEDKNIQDCFPNWKDEKDRSPNTPKVGTKKSVRRHKIKFPACLKSTPGGKVQNYYLHIIKVKSAFPQPQDSRERALYDLIQNDEGYGFFTPKPLPKLCDFPIYLKVGQVMVTIHTNYATVPLDEALLNLVKTFHYFIFDQVLDIAKKFVVFEGLVNCMYVVPVQVDMAGSDNYDISWDVMQAYDTIQPVTRPSNQVRKAVLVKPQSYTNSVVTPWYRCSIPPDRYIVSKVLEHMTPRSYLDADLCETFANYYTSKHNLEIVGDQNQPLLEVARITTAMNCILPRGASLRQLSDKQKKMISQYQDGDRQKGFVEIFIPEFCIKYDFPGLLWYKALMLPTILHRVHMLLVAQELITEIARDTKYGITCLQKDDEWLPLESNINIAVKSLLSEVELPSTVRGDGNSLTMNCTAAPKIMSMKDSLYKLQQKNLNKEYPWDEASEPMDIERNLKETTIMDIACYDEFISAPMVAQTVVKSPPPRKPINTAAAIKAPPVKLVSKLNVLYKKPVGRGPELRDVLSALTTINSNDNFNLERHESLGDSFLKYAASLYLFHKFPKLNEGQLTNIKGRLVSNRNLYYAGERINLPGRMKVKPFSPRDEFMIPGFFVPAKVKNFIEEKQIRPTFLIGVQFPQNEILSGQLSEESFHAVQQKFTDCNNTAEVEFEGQSLNVMQGYIHATAVSDKTVADSVEAIIGTYILSGGTLAGVKLLEWLRIIPAKDKLSELLYKRVETAITTKKATAEEINMILNYGKNDIEKIVNYTFKDSALLLEAMSHPSYSRNRLTGSYERLEFIGDAILDFLITTHIFENCPNLKPGDITDLRSALVNNSTFAAYTVKLGLHKLMCSNFDRLLFDAIGKFVEHQTERNHEILEDVLYLVNQTECQIAEYIDVPKVLSDIFESLVGAIYLDCGGNLEVVWNVVYAIMRDEIYAFSARIPRQPVAILYEDIHASPSFGTPKEMDNEIHKVLMPVSFTKDGKRLTVYGVGGNKSQAKRAAAKLALKILAT